MSGPTKPSAPQTDKPNPHLPKATLEGISANVSILKDMLVELGVETELTEDARAALHLADFSLHLAATLVKHLVVPFPEDERFHPLIAPAFAPPGLISNRIAEAIDIVDKTNDKTTKQRAIVGIIRLHADMLSNGDLRTEELPIGWPQLTMPIVLQATVVAGVDRFAAAHSHEELTEHKQALARAAVEAWISDQREDLIWDAVNEFLAAFGLEANTPPPVERERWQKARRHKYTHPLAKLRIKIRRK
jgi:hypothetical protein